MPSNRLSSWHLFRRGNRFFDVCYWPGNVNLGQALSRVHHPASEPGHTAASTFPMPTCYHRTLRASSDAYLTGLMRSTLCTTAILSNHCSTGRLVRHAYAAQALTAAAGRLSLRNPPCKSKQACKQHHSMLSWAAAALRPRKRSAARATAAAALNP